MKFILCFMLVLIFSCKSAIEIESISTSRLNNCLNSDAKSCLKVISVATKSVDRNEYIDYEISLNKFNYDYQIVGRKLPWNGWITRAKTMLLALEQLKYKTTSKKQGKIFILSTDTGDVMAQRSEKDLFKIYKEKISELVTFDKEHIIIVGGEWFCGGNCINDIDPYYDYHKIEKKKRIFKYAQGGFLFGRLNDMIKYYRYTKNYMESNNDDQLAMGAFALKHPEKIYIDYKQEFVATMVDGGGYDKNTKIHLNSVYNYTPEGIKLNEKLNKKFPAFIHIPNKKNQRRLYNKVKEHLKKTAWKKINP